VLAWGTVPRVRRIPLVIRTLFLFLGIVSTAMAQSNPTATVVVTAEGGAPMTQRDDVVFAMREARHPSIRIFPDRPRHVIDGIGSSFTEASAFVLAHLDPAKRREVMERIYGAEGANFTLTRTHIGACDFSVEGKYSYLDTPGDTELESFSIAPDERGFDPAKYPGVRDTDYDLLPMIREALEIKRAQGDDLRIVASAWTAPTWMKDIEEWFIPASSDNGWQGTGGSLKPEHVGTYAAYLARYVLDYRDAGVPIWGMTPVNEPNGNSGFWESMHFTPESQNVFVNEHLAPTLRAAGLGDVRLLVYDQNRDHLEEWADVILADPRSAENVYGVALHWYSSTYKVYEKILERVRAEYPDHTLVHTEGCIDNLGVEAGDGIRDPEGFQEEGWFGDDAWWWNRNATDWAYSAEWWPAAEEDHPMYVPVHRYARDIIVGLDHGLSGWIDWNVVLDRDGGPNHVGNFCGAPIMIDTATGEIHYTPVFHVLAQLSRTIRPGDRALATEAEFDGLPSDAVHGCATVNSGDAITVTLLNTTQEAVEIDVVMAERVATVRLEANSLTSLQWDPLDD